VFVDIATDLIITAQAGDAQSLVGLVEVFQGPVYTVALAIVRNPVDAADMTQETFVRLLRSLHTFRGEGTAFPAWVHRMTVNVCLDALRRKQRAPRPLAVRPDLDGTPLLEPASGDRWVQPEWRVESNEAAAEVQAALATLSGAQREALTLHYLEDRPYDEIAARMGVPLNTAKSHVLRGKERMARVLGRYRGERGTLRPPPRRASRLDLAAATG
jgi:RNA polymerase sigma-70 factor (ECF subfamily)